MLFPGPNETVEHLALKLAAYILFWEFELIVQPSAKHTALLNQEFIPDLMGLNDAGEVKLWVECGQVSMNKLTKLTRRFPYARVVVIKENERESERFRQDLKDQHDHDEKIEVLSWPAQQFKEWMRALQEKTEVFGEGGGLSLNVVINEHPLVAEMKIF